MINWLKARNASLRRRDTPLACGVLALLSAATAFLFAARSHPDWTSYVTAAVFGLISLLWVYRGVRSYTRNRSTLA